jgi:hypothetical protein
MKCVRYWREGRDGINWTNGFVECPFSDVREDGTFKGCTAKIVEPPPSWCRYILEHTLSI